MAQGAPTALTSAVFENSNIFLTNWYDSLITPGSGFGNPNNTNTGFVQLYDSDGSTRSSVSGGWTDGTYTRFSINVEGANAGAADTARLWPAPVIGGAAETSKGTFLSYQQIGRASGREGGCQYG